MAEPLKNMFNSEFLNNLSEVIIAVKDGFEAKHFKNDVLNSDWAGMELKERMRHITTVLNAYLDSDYEKNVEILLRALRIFIKKGVKQQVIEFMILPDFIEVYGIDHYETSMDAFEEITQFTSCEFGVRPFLIKYPEKGMKRMVAWANHPHPMVRRLATEGCRPRLPWAMALPEMKKDPEPIIPILEKLKNDVSESVRRSVANNLNDISKDNPELVIALIKKWQGLSKEVDWVIKHACRGLLKQGNSEVLKIFGFTSPAKLEIQNLEIKNPKVRIGESLLFNFKLINKNDFPAKIRLEYGLYFKKANGGLAKKVFTISEKSYDPNSTNLIERKQPFKVITTRKLYKGIHQLTIIVNGKESHSLDFELT